MRKTMLLVGFTAGLLVGCDNKSSTMPMPEVNDTNCQIKTVRKIDDKAARETFAGLCSRRSPTGGGIVPTEKPMNWLELADPKDQKGTKP